MKKKKKVKARITKGEKKLYSLAICAFVFTMVLKIFCGAGIGHLNMSIEQLEYKINNQEKKNESLTMKVNELTCGCNKRLTRCNNEYKEKEK